MEGTLWELCGEGDGVILNSGNPNTTGRIGEAGVPIKAGDEPIYGKVLGDVLHSRIGKFKAQIAHLHKTHFVQVQHAYGSQNLLGMLQFQECELQQEST